MSPLRRWRSDDPLAGTLEPEYPPRPPAPDVDRDREEATASVTDEDEPVEAVERPPLGAMRRFGRGLGEVRRRVLPLPDEVIDEFMGHGERMIHNDHPSFRSFVVENGLLFGGFLLLAVLFLGITFNGSLIAAALILLVLSVILLVLVLKRLGDRYTSYVVTDTRIMRISGVISRRAHSIPWVRVTDLTIEQSLMGRLFGYATLHIESANEDSGLRDLEGVSDPMQFNQYVVDMVVAKQGATEPIWERTGAPPPVGMGRGLRRLRMARRLRDLEGGARGPGDHHEGDDRDDTRGVPGGDRRTGDGEGTAGPAPAPAPTGAGSVRRTDGPEPDRGGEREGDRDREGGRSPVPPYSGADDDVAELDAETLAARLRSPGGPDLPWRK
ncbi:MAG TPA: PH domain-containing protein [Acidimicrobiales bacterium]|nr:PH domain-containing protein [Acidimicrobiales bacterium]